MQTRVAVLSWILRLLAGAAAPACEWVSFAERDSGPGDPSILEPDAGADADDTPGEDAGRGDAAVDACEDVTCAGDRVCSAGDCVDPRVDEDEDGFGASSDCDDRDRDVVPGSTRPCDTECGDGVETCAGGRWGTCSAPTEYH
jgi:hypothetical protein